MYDIIYRVFSFAYVYVCACVHACVYVMYLTIYEELSIENNKTIYKYDDDIVCFVLCLQGRRCVCVWVMPGHVRHE